MSKSIEIKNVSKRYRIGDKESLANDDSVIYKLFSLIKYPFLNFKKLYSLSNFKNDKKNKNTLWALDDVSFDINSGDVVGIIGNNGAGKSTLLKILSRITSPTYGEIILNGKVGSLLEVGTGFHPDLTGRENIYLNGSILGMSKNEINKKINKIIKFSGVEKFIDTVVKRYSSGMRIRLAFAVAAHLDTDILIIDEVLAVGDVKFQKKALGQMKKIVDKNQKTVLIVSHNLAIINSFCNKVVLLENGKVKDQGLPNQVIKKYLSNISAKSGLLKDRKDRYGNQLFKFLKILILDENDKEINLIYIGDYLKIHLEYEINNKIIIDDMIINVGFKDEMGNEVTYFATDEMGFRLKKNKNNTLELIIPSFLLRKNIYKVWLFASYLNTRRENQCDVIESAAEIEVETLDFYNSGKFPRAKPSIILNGNYKC